MKWTWAAGICGFTILALAVPQNAPRGLSVIITTGKAEADTLRERVLRGESFDLLAMRHSIGSSAAEGGFMGLHRREDLGEDLRTSMDKLRLGDAGPVVGMGEVFAFFKWSSAEEDQLRNQYLAGLQALVQRRYPDATALLLTVARNASQNEQMEPLMGRSLAALAEAYRFQQNYAAGEATARQALSVFERLAGPQHKSLVPAIESLAGITLAQEKHSEALGHYKRALSIRSGGNPERNRVDPISVIESLAAVRSAAYFKGNQLKDSLREFDAAISSGPFRSELYIATSDELIKAGLSSEGESVIQRAVREYPESRAVRFAEAEVYLLGWKLDKALETLQKADELTDVLDPAMNSFRRGLLYEQMGNVNVLMVRFDDAEAALSTAIELNPNRIEARLLRANLLVMRDRSDEASSEYMRALALQPSNIPAHLGIAEVSLRLKKFSEAVTSADRVLAIEPASLKARHIRAQALLGAGRTAEGNIAIQEYRKFAAESMEIQKRLRESSALAARASARIAAGEQGEEVLDLFRKAIATPAVENKYDLYLQMGLTQAKTGQHRAAAETFQTAIGLGGDHYLLHRNLAIAYDLLGDSRATRERAIYFQRLGAALGGRLQ